MNSLPPLNELSQELSQLSISVSPPLAPARTNKKQNRKWSDLSFSDRNYRKI